MRLITHYRDYRNKAAIYLVTLFGIIFAIQIACKKVLPEEIPSLVTINVTDITSASITSGDWFFLPEEHQSCREEFV